MDLSSLIGAITGVGLDIAFDQVKKRRAIVELLHKLGFKPNQVPADFDSAYMYSLIEYGTGKPKPVLDILTSELVKSAFRQYFEHNDQKTLSEEVETALEVSEAGAELRRMDLDPHREVLQFSAVFNTVIDRSRTVVEVRQDQKMDDIHLSVETVLSRLVELRDIKQLAAEVDRLSEAQRSVETFADNATGGDVLRVFVSSKMTELRDVREVTGAALKDRGLEAVVYEVVVGARPESILDTSLHMVEEADVFVGIFWQQYGGVTAEEFRHARRLRKPCFVYVRDKDAQRESKLAQFLEEEVFDVKRGVTYAYFGSAVEFGRAVADDVMKWLVRRYRELSAQIRLNRTSGSDAHKLQSEAERLRSISREALPIGQPVDELGRQVRDWLVAVGHVIERDVQREGGYADLVIKVRRTGRPFDRVLVRSVDGEIEVNQVDELQKRVLKDKYDEGWLVCERRVSRAAHDVTGKEAGVFAFTLDDLVDEYVDFSSYFQWLEQEYVARRLDDYYVPLAGLVNDFGPNGQVLGTSRYDDLEIYLDQWLDATDKEHISVLGEFGTGKTWLAFHYAHRIMTDYKQMAQAGRRRPRVPLVIQLHYYSQGFRDVEALLYEFVFHQHQIGQHNYNVLDQLNRMGRLLLIFDGFDEMAVRVDRQKLVNNFWELAKVAISGSKVILTCRTEYFHFAQQEREILRGETPASNIARMLPAPKFEAVHLDMFSQRQVAEVLSRRTTQPVVSLVMGRSDLVDIARRPVLVELILEALEEVEAGNPISLAHVYYYAVVKKMQRDIKAVRTFTSLADKLYFMCELAWEMYTNNHASLSYKQFPERIRSYFGSRVLDPEEDHWQYDLLGQTMLGRDYDGNYYPAHRSFLEFFVAYKFAAELGALREEFLGAARQQLNIEGSAASTGYAWSIYFKREREASGEITAIAPLADFVTESLERLGQTVGKQKWTKAVLELIEGIIDVQGLVSVLESARGATEAASGYTIGNVVTLLNQLNYPVRQLDLSQLVLAGADFSQADLTNARCTNANLSGAMFHGTTIENADFTYTDLRQVEFREMGSVTSLAWSPDGLQLAIGAENGSISVWSSEDWDELASLQQFVGAVSSLVWIGNRLYAGSSGGYVSSWNTSDWKRVWTSSISGHAITAIVGRRSKRTPENDLVFSTRYATYNFDARGIEISRASAGGIISAIAVSSDSEYVAIGDEDGTILLLSDDKTVTLHGSQSPATRLSFTGDRTLVVYRGARQVNTLVYTGPDDPDIKAATLDLYNFEQSEEASAEYNRVLADAADEFVTEHGTAFQDKYYAELSQGITNARVEELKLEFFQEEDPDAAFGVWYWARESVLSDYPEFNIDDADLRSYLAQRNCVVGCLEEWDLSTNTRMRNSWSRELVGVDMFGFPETSAKIILAQPNVLRVWDHNGTNLLGASSIASTGITTAATNPRLRLLAIGCEDGNIYVQSFHGPAEQMGQTVRRIRTSMNCKGARFLGSKGLTADQVSFLAQRGAIVDQPVSSD